MRQSNLFTKTRKEAPKDEVARNAELLLRAGFIHKELAGVYSFLPLGLRVLNKIISVIRKEMDGLSVGGVSPDELSLSAIQDKSIWEKTGRWADETMDVWFKTELKNGSQVGLAPTHEEPLTRLMKDHIHSYRDLPRYVYQFQTKFRNEIRAKSGIIRGREFLMKDLYSFSADEKNHQEFYDAVTEAYKRIFKTVGIGSKTYLTRASGGSFSKFSHEFQTVCEAGEDTIYTTPDFSLAVNEEIVDMPEAFGDMPTKDKFKPRKSIEVGNIFNLGTRFSEALGLTYLDRDGKPQPVVMGCYGIGPGRVMGAIVEVLSDEKGIVWPESVAPFSVHLIEIPSRDSHDDGIHDGDGIRKTAEKLYNTLTHAGIRKTAEKLYNTLTHAGIEVLLDDRDIRPGEKFADADLIGIPYRIVVSDKTLTACGFEIKKRT
ncbi:MAG: aminoacyl--tRNA ligase-related protein, partial [Patescibacteria group bacterium]